MKIASIIIRFVCAALFIALGIVVLIMGVGIEYFDDWVFKETYVGDAYTGIQNATAVVSENVSNLGHTVEHAFDLLFVFSGILLMIVGVYVVACTFSMLEKRKPKIPNAPQQNYSNNTQARNFDVKTQNNYNNNGNQ